MTPPTSDRALLLDHIARTATQVAEAIAELAGIELDGVVVLARLADGPEAALSWAALKTPSEVASALLGALMAVCREHELPLAVAELPTPRGQG